MKNNSVATATDFCYAICYDGGTGRMPDHNRRLITMKRFISMMTVLVLALGLCAFANAEGTDISALTVTSPNGAPALALATMAVENKDNYTYIAADTIAAAFAGQEADFIIVPVNAGAKL